MNHPQRLPLKNEVERVYGKKVVSYTDCVIISKEITLRTGFRLNVNTLRRFFGLVQANYPPSLTTLDILSKYCGFKSYEHFNTFLTTEPSVNTADSPLLLYLDTLFNKAPVSNPVDPIWISIVKETFLFLQKYPHLLDPFQRTIAKTVIGREIYFEHFVNIDQLNGCYGNGLRYYLAEKNTCEGRLFTHSLLCLRYYLTNESKSLERHYHELMHQTIHERVHPFVCARYFSAQLFFHRNKATEVYKILSAARSFFKTFVPAEEVYHSVPCFELVMADALILTQQPLEALFYIREARKKSVDDIPSILDVKLFSSLDLYEAAAYSMLGEEEVAKKVLRKVNTLDFYFLSRQYNNIIFLEIKSVLFPSKARINYIQVDDLTKRTGFVKLSTLFDRGRACEQKRTA